MSSLAPALQGYFTDRLLSQRRVSPNTVASYRDTFRLLLEFAQEKTGTPPARLEITHLDAPLIGAFLEHLERERGNSVRTRNIRLAAIHSFFHYCALRHPEHAAVIQRVLAIPTKRSEKRIVTYLTPHEITALLASPDRHTWAGRRDYALLLTATQTGLRISELIGLTCADVQLGTGAHLRAFGKGRKERVAPLTPQTVAVLRAWMRERQGQPADALFPSRDGGPLTRDAIERRLAKHTATARRKCPTLNTKRVTMHILRHTAAMMLLTAGIDTTTIALWLGHEQERTTRVYLHADLALKQRVLDQATPPSGKPGRYRASDSLLTFLDRL
jgi:site-specific recombinase XerD